MAKVRIGDSTSGVKTLIFACPGCGENHGVDVDGPAKIRWSWNQSLDRPTLSPSILCRFDRMTAAGLAEYQRWLKGEIPTPESFEKEKVTCHFFVREGRIEFCGDCTHGLRGQTVEMKEVED